LSEANTLAYFAAASVTNKKQGVQWLMFQNFLDTDTPS